MPNIDDNDDDWDEDEDPNEGYVKCPSCGELMLEDAEHCSSCDQWITSDMKSKTKPWWMIAIILILILMMVLAMVPF